VFDGTNGSGLGLTEPRLSPVGKLEGAVQADLVEAVRELTSEIRELRAAGVSSVLGAREGGAEPELRRIVHELVESLDELEADNAKLRAENERLVAHQATLSSLASRASIDPPPAPASDDPLIALTEENVRLRGALARLQADETEIRSVLRSLDTSRAWKVVTLYWSLARRFGRDGSGSSRPHRS
jgi:hypothetical protein